MHRLLAILAYLILFSFPVLSQKMVYDSVLIDFGYINHLHINAYADTIIDLRDSKPLSVGVYEKYKYVFIPVDKFVMLNKPLSSTIKDLFAKQQDSLKHYQIEIKQFELGTRKKDLLSTNYVCNAALMIYSVKDNTRTYKGTLLYENEVGQSRKTKAGYETILDDWKLKFVEDMQELNRCNDTCQIYNFRKESDAYKKNMFINSEFYIGPDSWLVDAEIVFSRPESQKLFFREASGLRYRYNKKYESFETNLQNKQTFYRFSNNLLGALKLKTFLGLNRWSETEYKNRGLEDIFLLDLSFSQQIMYNRFFRKGLTAGIGIMENVTYIYSEDFKFKPYAMVLLGYKF